MFSSGGEGSGVGALSTMTVDPIDFHCWCQAEPSEPCKTGTSEAGDLELKIARWHQERMRAARDANAALRAPRAALAPVAAKYAAYSPAHGWLVDLCVGATWSFDIDEATWFDSPAEIDAAFAVVEIAVPVGLIHVRVK